MTFPVHFPLVEFVVSQTATRNKIDNTPSPQIILVLDQLANVLERIRNEVLGGHACTITSGYRCPRLNSAIGSLPSSHHILGAAADFICPGFGRPIDICKAIASSQVPIGQLIHEFGEWCHFSIYSVPNPINKIITIDHDNGTRIGLLEV
jgi:hypothetical protein